MFTGASRVSHLTRREEDAPFDLPKNTSRCRWHYTFGTAARIGYGGTGKQNASEPEHLSVSSQMGDNQVLMYYGEV
jgi:hypothetical protein